MSEKRKLSSLFPLGNTKLTDIYPFSADYAYCSGYGLYSTRADPVWQPPSPVFSLDFLDLHPDGTSSPRTGLSTDTTPIADLIVFGTPQENFTLTNLTDGPTYTDLEWSVRHLETDTYLLSSAMQTYTITPVRPTPNSTTTYCTYDITLTAFFHGTQGTASMRIVVTYPPDPIAIIHERGPHVLYTDGNYTGPSNSLSKTYMIGEAAPWSYDNVSSGLDVYDTYSWNLTPGQAQVETINNLSGSWDTSTAGTFLHTLTLNLLQGFDVVSSATLQITVVVVAPSITFDGITTTYTAQQTPTVVSSVTHDTILTFTNSTPTADWDNSVITLTVI